MIPEGTPGGNLRSVDLRPSWRGKTGQDAACLLWYNGLTEGVPGAPGTCGRKDVRT